MSNKKTVIRYYELKSKSRRTDEEIDVSYSIWEEIFDYVKNLDISKKIISSRGVTYEIGILKNEGKERYALYIGKRREGVDAPWESSESDNSSISKVSLADGHRIVEPAIIYPISRSSKGVFGVFRTGNAATPSAMEEVIDSIFEIKDFKIKDTSLVPLTGNNAIQFLSENNVATKLEFKIDSGFPNIDLGEGSIAQGLESVYSDVGEGEASVQIIVSFGNKKLESDKGIIRFLRGALDSHAVKSAKAKILTEDDSGDINKVSVDFIKDKITQAVDIDSSGDSVDIGSIFASLDEAELQILRRQDEEMDRFQL